MTPRLPPHTLHGLISKLDRAGSDPELRRRLDAAFAKHERDVRRLCARQLPGRGPEQVDEVVQETLLEAWRKLPAFRSPSEQESRWRAYLLDIARFKCANARRKHTDALCADGFLDAAADHPHPLARLAEEERDELVARAADRVLEDVDRRVVHLRWELDLPLPDVAERCGLPDANAVRVRLQRCKRRLDAEIRRLLAERGLGESFLDPISP